MDLALDAVQSRNLPEFLQKFAVRAARMLQADWCGVAVFQGKDAEIYCTDSPRREPDPRQKLLAKAILQAADTAAEEIAVLPFDRALFPALQAPRKNLENILLQIVSGDGERFGCICVLRPAQPLDESERRLLRALASHASLSLVNFRRFSQLERSKRQWVEDIDAITDYIVVHDQSWRIVRTNRSLASELGAAPVALVG